MPVLPQNRHRYPHNWEALSQHIRFVRANGRCECDGRCRSGKHEGRCAERHGEPAQSFNGKVVLTTAHLDHTPEHNDHANLMAMCQLCHLIYDRPHHMKSAERRRESTRGAAAREATNARRRARRAAMADE